MSGSLGLNGWVGFAPEAVPGTPEATVDVFYPTEEFNAGQKPGLIEREVNIQQPMRLRSKQGPLEPYGDLKTELMASLPHVFYWMLGAVSTSQPDVTSAPTCYRHTITVSLADLVALTCEADKVDSWKKQTSTKINKAKISSAFGEIAKLEFDWLALSQTEPGSLSSTPSFVNDPLTFAGAAVSLGGSTSTIINSVELEIDNNLEQVGALNSTRSMAQVRRKGKPGIAITGKMDFIDYSAAEYTKLLNATTFAMILTWTGDVIAGAYSKYFKVTLPDCLWQPGSLEPAISSEVITTDADFEAYYDTVTSSGITIEVQNTVSALT